MYIEIVIILLFIIISGAVSGSETAFFSYKLNGNEKKLQKYRKIIAKPYKLLLLILIINVFVNIGFTSIFEHFVTEQLKFGAVASFIFITVFLLLLGEIIPKAIAINKPLFFIKLLSPIYLFLEKPTKLIMKLFYFLENFFENIKTIIEPHKMNKEDLNSLIEYIVEDHDINKENSLIFAHILNWNNQSVKNLMDDFNEILEIDEEKALHKLRIGETPFLISRDKKGEINQILEYKNKKVSKLDDSQIVSGEKTILLALKKLLLHDYKILIITDEYGDYKGYIKKSRMMKMLFEDLNHEEKKKIIQKFSVEALISINEINREYGLKIASGNYTNLNGYILENLGRIPEILESFFIDGVKFTILECKTNIINRIQIEQGE